MREDEILELLASWDERLRRVDENLLALEAVPTYQMLAGGARAGLLGVTKQRVAPALDALAELFEHRERLSAVLTRAKELAGALGFWNKDEKLAEIAGLLGGRFISLGTRQMPVAERNLLDPTATEVAVVPDELLGEMVRAYQLARDAVADVAAAWGRLEPTLLALEQDVAEVQKEAAALGQTETTDTELEPLLLELGRVRLLVSTDPLGVAGSVDATLAPRVRDLRAKLSALAAQKERVTRGLEETDALLAEVDRAAEAASEAAARAAREIAGFDVGVAAQRSRQEVVQGLLPWREKIATAAQAAHWRAADVGLARWLEVARGVLAAEVEVARAAEAAEAKRTELLGRLSARRAQQSALAARGVPASPDLDLVARSAEALLRDRPTDLEKAAREVERYEEKMRELSPTTRA